MATPTYPLTFPPNPGIKDASVHLARKTTVAMSPFTASEQRAEWPFSQWVISGTITEVDESTDAEAIRDWRSFIIELRGQLGTFYMSVPGYSGPSTNYSGTQGAVKGASQLGESVTTDNWTINTPIMNRGDYFNLGSELKMCMADVSSDGIGEATILFEPTLGNSPADDSSIELDDPTAIMRMATDTNTWNIRSPIMNKFSFEAVEVV